ncbi:MAG: SpoIIE family protein phosphatase, partial [Nostoc sp. C3-bin3]|nr:SpoIIE family protein phosphatase [Nostoc sp. C3-bin3]
TGISPRKSEVKLLKTPGMPVGMFPEAKYVDGFCNIEEFSTLYIFSDGAYEITKSDGTLWSLDAFIQLLVSLQHPVDCQLDYILSYLIALNSKDAFDDDLSILQMNFD